ncbi:MAG: serine/threonine protein kinase [Spirulinaceae cyanobacterium RM2_2_10]|nr:serine/threonine protein kinase [Spirulinaceae cyanobacterium SM2_1_0]NJO20140.1 serine/threonine protein kinase [Spirulinaceae cyanobacterium RM2_2_10]
MPYYRAYGLHLAANCPLPGLQPLSEQAAADVCIVMGTQPPHLAAVCQPWYLSAATPLAHAPSLRVTCDRDRQRFHFRYYDDAEFLVQLQPAQIWANWSGKLVREDIATYLLGPILGFLLRWRGTTCLHASAVAVGEQAIALVGQAGAGKSTTAAAFAQAGYRVLTDDVAALTETAAGFCVQPAYPRLRLWSEAVEFLYGRADALPRLVPDHPHWDKRYLDLAPAGEASFQTQPLPLAAVYLLAARQGASNAPRLEAIAPSQALVELIANTYTNYLLDKTRRQQEFASLSHLLQCLPVRRAVPHRDPARLPDFLTLLLADYQASIPSV